MKMSIEKANNRSADLFSTYITENVLLQGMEVLEIMIEVG